MCRFLTYQGAPISLADLLYRPLHSLIKQSYQAEQLSQPLNGDGFGVGWYSPEVDPFPCVFKSISPAWADMNLQNVSVKIYSGCQFAHIRAASPGMLVQRSNCHPFSYGRYMFMHNGTVRQFAKIKRALRASLSDTSYHMVQGTTDSEHAFALLLDAVGDLTVELGPDALRAALVAAIRRIVEIGRAEGVSESIFCNFAVTDGRSTAVSRFAAAPEGVVPATLYYSVGSRYVCTDDGDCDMLEGGAGAVMIASEPITRRVEDWTAVPPNHTVSVGPDLQPEVAPIEL